MRSRDCCPLCDSVLIAYSKNRSPPEADSNENPHLATQHIDY